ncbi:lipase family protein [Pontibacillus yanchengensis]|uniref:Lipase family protein n=1 Tax=Pontibacillus yanchengensis TaxID=462910 RepID=A0ACC7VHC4_9BACI|nr:lipase family protein [Pontibacillus yanchengensis]MYL54371.1 lipase family protein [Pontibacillus yanchengensis]
MLLPFYHKQLSRFLLNMCELSYVQFKQNGAFPIPKGFKLVKTFKATTLHSKEWFGFIIESEHSVIIAFRGTQTEPDWVADAQVFQIPYPYVDNAGLVHNGFLSIYESCRDDIFQAYQHIPPHKKLYITGHSLGGALATLHALDAKGNAPFAQVIMYNYGSPRVGNDNFTQSYTTLTPLSIRFANMHDLVTQLPPTVIYCPFTKQLWYYSHIRSPMEFSLQTDTIKGNHSLTTYRKGIEIL